MYVVEWNWNWYTNDEEYEDFRFKVFHLVEQSAVLLLHKRERDGADWEKAI